ncbi:MAG: DUF2275 domain-containing protein [Nitrospiraceae bacterium]|nr:DUF2275 domain-containing protein [Nitrospiraceae bacterium]
MNHNDIRHKLSEYIDESVTGAEKATIEEHLKTCADCSEALRELRKTIEQVKQIEEVEAPAWMASKIMAKVRDEEGQKKSFWQRFLVPLFTYRPAQAVAVLFIAVISYYIYTNLNPAAKYSEEPVAKLSQREAPVEMPDKRIPKPSQQPEKKIAQEPAFRSLDMKYEYEKTAAPKPREEPPAAAPAPAQEESRPLKDEMDKNMFTEAPKAKALPPPAMPEQAAPAGSTLVRGSAAAEKAEPRAATKAPASENDAEARQAVTEHFANVDLPKTMKVKGLSFTTHGLQAGHPDLEWMQKTSVFLTKQCEKRYVIDVDLSGSLSKYLYCYDHRRVLLLGIFEFRNDTWSEIPHP